MSLYRIDLLILKHTTPQAFITLKILLLKEKIMYVCMSQS